MTKDQKTFIETIGAAAHRCYKVSDILPSLVIAMAIKESAWGKSELSKKHFNFFGMKWVSTCGCKWVEYSTKEWDKKTQQYITVKAKFRSYSSVEEGIQGFYTFLQYKRYANLKGEKDPLQACLKIQQDGWATAPTYGASLYNDYIVKYTLTAYDAAYLMPDPEPDIKPYYIKGKTYVTKVNLYIREKPNGRKRKMYEITADGKVHSYTDPYGDAVLRAGTRVTCIDVIQDGGSCWMLIPSGWICAVFNNEKIYVGGA